MISVQGFINKFIQCICRKFLKEFIFMETQFSQLCQPERKLQFWKANWILKVW